MPRLPARFAAVILCFAPLFRQRSWRHAEVLLIGAILAPGRRTVTSILRITGLCRERRFVNYHRVLNRAAWSGRAAARVLLGLLLDAFVPAGPVLLGLDDTIERRRGKRISAKGIYRDPVRSSHGPLRQGQRPALAQPDAAGADLLGRAGLGAAVPDRPRPLGAVLPRARAAAQEADRLGAAAGPAGPPLDAGPAPRAGGRQRLRRARVPGRPAPAGASPASPACGWMPRSTDRPRRASPAPSGARGPRASACRPWPRCWPTRPRRWQRVTVPAGTARASAWWRSARIPPSGATAACRSCRSAGCCCAIPAGASTRRPCSAPTWRRSRCRSSAGSSSAGSWKSPSARCATTSASRPSASGRTRPSPAPRPACSGCSRSSPCWPSRLGCRARVPGLSDRLVPQAAADLRRQRSPRYGGQIWSEQGFADVPARRRAAETPASPPRRHRLRALPRRLNGQSRA